MTIYSTLQHPRRLINITFHLNAIRKCTRKVNHFPVTKQQKKSKLVGVKKRITIKLGKKNAVYSVRTCFCSFFSHWVHKSKRLLELVVSERKGGGGEGTNAGSAKQPVGGIPYPIGMVGRCIVSVLLNLFIAACSMPF